jgi:hypothetical protein
MKLGTKARNYCASADRRPVQGEFEGSIMEHMTGLQQFLTIVSQPDNIPIGAMMILVLFFTYVSFKQARRNDQLIEHGMRDKVIDEMRK